MCNTLRSIVSRIFVFPSDRNTHYITNTHTHTRKHSVQRFFSSCATSRKRKNSGRLVCPTNWKSSRKQISWCWCCCFCSAILGLPNLIYQLRVRAGRSGWPENRSSLQSLSEQQHSSRVLEWSFFSPGTSFYPMVASVLGHFSNLGGWKYQSENLNLLYILIS